MSKRKTKPAKSAPLSSFPADPAPRPRQSKPDKPQELARVEGALAAVADLLEVDYLPASPWQRNPALGYVGQHNMGALMRLLSERLTAGLALIVEN
ncbi:MAG: hypothetical protein HQL87_09555 [Magnetococcales bacterium]|nr:hypothetical protein [Magnetococcales bacterium]